MPKIFCFIIPLNRKLITSTKQNMGFFNSISNYFGPLINFQCQHPRHLSLNCHQSVLLDQAPLQLDREGIKARENGERGGGG